MSCRADSVSLVVIREEHAPGVPLWEGSLRSGAGSLMQLLIRALEASENVRMVRAGIEDVTPRPKRRVRALLGFVALLGGALAFATGCVDDARGPVHLTPEMSP